MVTYTIVLDYVLVGFDTADRKTVMAIYFVIWRIDSRSACLHTLNKVSRGVRLRCPETCLSLRMSSIVPVEIAREDGTKSGSEAVRVTGVRSIQRPIFTI